MTDTDVESVEIPEGSSISLLTRTSEAIFRADHRVPRLAPFYGGLDPAARKNYEAMAVAALTVAYREPVSSS